ncbi:MAG TPA: response regulator [Gemmataceae bacterium]|nr:response regulator [Gemmataceae bacterium]
MDVVSAPGRGTAFTVYLPCAEAAPAADRCAADAARNPNGTETVLLVEDEPAVRGLAGLALRHGGYTVLEAGGGREALRLGEQHPGPIHLLVSDVVMPGMGGRELADRLTGVRPGLRVLYLSGYTDDAVVRHGILSAEVAFLQKPFTPAALARKVREVLG